MKGKRPACDNCRTRTNVHARPRPGQIEGAHGALRWLCGDCEILEDAPNLERLTPPPRRSKVAQMETLW